jgi:hypothetical protein
MWKLLEPVCTLSHGGLHSLASLHLLTTTSTNANMSRIRGREKLPDALPKEPGAETVKVAAKKRVKKSARAMAAAMSRPKKPSFRYKPGSK